MPASIITIANQKGGCGKTTLTMQLAGSLSEQNYRVLVIDADPQATATRWASSADETPFPATVAGLAMAGGKVHREIQKYIQDYDYILVDCPPAVESPIPQSALLVSDLVLVPVIPSPADLWAATGIQQLIENAQGINESLQARLVPNMQQTNTTLAKEALDVLNDFGMPVLPGLSLRTAFRQSAVFGNSVHAMGSKAQQAIEEIETICSEVLAILK